MQGLDQYLWPYIAVQIISIIFLYVSIKNTRLSRFLFSLLFFWAAIVNMQFGLKNPDKYLEYAPLALPFYRDFILGWFSRYNYIIIPMIAIAQFIIALGMLLRGWLVKWACIGAIVFLVSIAPLMVGSGFPFSIIVSIAAYMILKKDNCELLWHKPKLARS